MMMNEFAGTVRSQKRGSILFAAAVLLLVCVLAVGAVSAADTVTVSNFTELQNNISTSDDLTIIVTDNFSISNTLTIDSGKNITLRADGTHRTLSRDNSFTGNLFRVNFSGNLTITGYGTSNLTLDGTGQASNSLVKVNGGNFTLMDGGILTNNTVPGINGGGVYVDNSGTFTMSGGEISKNKASNGGGVYGTGGSTFTMERGTISDNEAYYGYGGGVYVGNGEFTMSGGTISGNTATSGGGVYVNDDGEFEMSSGTISDNAASEGGGVYVIGIFELLSGSSSVDSVYLTSEKVINVTAALTTTQVTNINLQNPVHGTKVVTISPAVSEPNYLNDFKLNQSLERFALEYQSPDIVLKQLSCIVSFNAQGGTPTPDEQSVQYDNPVTEPDPAPTWEGHTLEGWYTENTCQNKWDFTTPVTDDMTLYAKWTPNKPGPTPVPPSGGVSSDGNMDNAYRVLFNDGATTLYIVTDLSAGDKLTKPEDPVKDGYTFAGWHKDSACTQAWDFNDGITGDMTLYAKWTPQETVTPTATATPTVTATATATQTAEPTGNASPAPTVQPDNEGSNGETTATSGISLPYLIGGIAIVILAILLLLFLFLRHTVTFLIPAGGELEEYRIKVWHGKYIDPGQLPELLRTAAWYRDPARQERWDFNEDRVTKSIELYIG